MVPTAQAGTAGRKTWGLVEHANIVDVAVAVIGEIASLHPVFLSAVRVDPTDLCARLAALHHDVDQWGCSLAGTDGSLSSESQYRTVSRLVKEPHTVPGAQWSPKEQQALDQRYSSRQWQVG